MDSRRSTAKSSSSNVEQTPSTLNLSTIHCYKSSAPICVTISHHRITLNLQLEPKDGSTSNEDLIDVQIIPLLKDMLDSNNELVKCYRMVRHSFKENEHLDLKLRLIAKRQKNGRTYNLPTASEVAALTIGDIGDCIENNDIENILKKPSISSSMFLSWMKCNQVDENARKLTYVEFPTQYFHTAQLPNNAPDIHSISSSNNRLINEELSYDKTSLKTDPGSSDARVEINLNELDEEEDDELEDLTRPIGRDHAKADRAKARWGSSSQPIPDCTQGMENLSQRIGDFNELKRERQRLVELQLLFTNTDHLTGIDREIAERKKEKFEINIEIISYFFINL
ncbi:hypothetical protein E3N88_26059 [Mikania micrantha]|uniref:Uncharacterized protein n=1 Tax=Mikania micrantha TaxID=192012 RepID=A0A5N6N846_9ASTR|nr:hypothetical protein E3N88_26059 [Mikania micrantha]